MVCILSLCYIWVVVATVYNWIYFAWDIFRVPLVFFFASRNRDWEHYIVRKISFVLRQQKKTYMSIQKAMTMCQWVANANKIIKRCFSCLLFFLCARHRLWEHAVSHSNTPNFMALSWLLLLQLMLSCLERPRMCCEYTNIFKRIHANGKQKQYFILQHTRNECVREKHLCSNIIWLVSLALCVAGARQKSSSQRKENMKSP